MIRFGASDMASTVFGIVKQSGGAIGVYSEPGQGTIFKIYFPCVDQSLSYDGPSEKEAPLRHGTETVLLVEDEPPVRALARRALEECHYTVLESSDGEAARGLADSYNGPIDLLATDVVMPKWSGRQLAEHLRATRPNMKVLYLSGYTDDAVVWHGILEAEVLRMSSPTKCAKCWTSLAERMLAP